MADPAQAKVGTDRRAHTRATLKTSVHFGSESNFYTGFTQDVSAGGLFVATHNVVPMGTVIDLVFSIPDKGPPITVQGEVRWAAEYNPSSDCSPGLGLRFVDLPEENRARIENWITHRETLFFDEE
jgi:uncharacterized protein (TIGR02266 family)